MKAQYSLLASAGHYLPSFFKMEVFSDESLVDIDQLSEQTAAVYFHEYLHYIQDVSTLHGLSNMIRMGEYIHHSINRIRSGPATFTVPIDPYAHSEGVDTTIKIIQLLNGDSATNDLSVTINYVVDAESTPVAFHGGHVPAIIIDYNNSKKYNFGATAVMESMAWIGEKHLFPASLAPPPLPYNAAELLANFIYPEFANNPLNVFALCDIALLTAEPGAAFYQKLLKLKEASFVPKDPKKVYDFFKADLFEHRGMTLNRSQMLSTLVHDSNLYLSGYFPGEQYAANVDWMRHVTLYGYSLRHHNMAFPLDILQHGQFYQNPYLKHTMRYLGSPLQLNSQDRATYIIIDEVENDRFRPDLNWAIAEVHKMFIGKHEGCGMKPFCKESAYLQNIPDFTDTHCHTNPWQRVCEKKTCSFVDIVNLWELQDKKPIINNKL